MAPCGPACRPACGFPEPRADLRADLRAALRGRILRPPPPSDAFGSALSRMEDFGERNETVSVCYLRWRDLIHLRLPCLLQSPIALHSR